MRMPHQGTLAGGKLERRLGVVHRFGILGRRNRDRSFELPNQRAARDSDDQILARVAIHALAQAWFASFSDQPRSIKLGDQIVQIMVGLEDDIAAAPAVAAARPALGHERFAMERHTPFAAVARSREDFDFINKHRCRANKKARPKTSPWLASG